MSTVCLVRAIVGMVCAGCGVCCGYVMGFGCCEAALSLLWGCLIFSDLL